MLKLMQRGLQAYAVYNLFYINAVYCHFVLKLMQRGLQAYEIYNLF
jgi:hypothetical protein